MDYLRPPRQFNRKFDRRQDGLYVPTKAVGFSPLSLGSALSAWYDFSGTYSTITLTSSKISSMTDGSGNGWTLSQLTGGSGPTYTATQNSKLVASWVRATPAALTSSLTIGAQPIWMAFAVANTDTASYTSFLTDAISGGRAIFAFQGSLGHPQLYAGSFSDSSDARNTTFSTYMLLFSGGSSYLRRDTVNKLTGGSPGTGAIGTGFILGGGQLNGGSPSANLGEFLIGTGTPSGTDQTNIEAWLKGRWATP